MRAFPIAVLVTIDPGKRPGFYLALVSFARFPPSSPLFAGGMLPVQFVQQQNVGAVYPHGAQIQPGTTPSGPLAAGLLSLSQPPPHFLQVA